MHSTESAKQVLKQARQLGPSFVSPTRTTLSYRFSLHHTPVCIGSPLICKLIIVQDEILLDVLHTRRFKVGELIRCGSTEDPELANYSERRSHVEKAAQDVLTERLTALREAQQSMCEWQDLMMQISASVEEWRLSIRDSWQRQ